MLFGYSHAAFTNSKEALFLEDKISLHCCLERAIAKAFPIPEEAPVIQIILLKKYIIRFYELQYTKFEEETVFLVCFLKIDFLET